MTHFAAQGFLISGLQFAKTDVGDSGHVGHLSCFHRENHGVLPSIIHRDVLSGLEEAQFTNLFGTHAAGREVGYTSAVENQAHVGDVHVFAEHGQAHGADLFDFGIRKSQDNIQVVNHQVQHDVDVQTACAEHAHPVNFEEQRLGDDLAR